MYHILICDDERDIVNALKIYLADPNYTLFEAYTGQEALDIMDREDIHLILMDIMMPELDGISAMVKIREKAMSPSFC
jgi:DNA-binding response OmpR family regulator